MNIKVNPFNAIDKEVTQRNKSASTNLTEEQAIYLKALAAKVTPQDISTPSSVSTLRSSLEQDFLRSFTRDEPKPNVDWATG